MSIEAFGHTDIGKKRQLNEDDYVCSNLTPAYSDQRNSLFLVAVADGIGGHAGGQLASALAVDVLRKHVKSALSEGTSFPNPQSILVQAFLEANSQIFQKATQDERLRGMGTTMVAALVTPEKAVISNVGDSRAYHIRNGHLEQITQDHSWKAEQRRTNSLPEKDILHSPFKNMLTRSLGFEPELKVDVFEMALDRGDYLVLCSDGLYAPITVRQIIKTIKHRKTPQKICKNLIKSAYRHGGNDNITAVVARIQGEAERHHANFSPSDTVKLDSAPLKDS